MLLSLRCNFWVGSLQFNVVSSPISAKLYPTILGATMTYTLANNAAAMMIRQICVVRFCMAEFNTDETPAKQMKSFAVLIVKGSLALTNNFLPINTLI